MPSTRVAHGPRRRIVHGQLLAQLERLDGFGRDFGLAYQAFDDLRDADLSECSILLVLSEDEVRERIRSHVGSAVEALVPFGEGAAALRAMAEMVAGRVS